MKYYNKTKKMVKLIITLDEELDQLVDIYRAQNRLGNKAEACVNLVRLQLKKEGDKSGKEK